MFKFTMVDHRVGVLAMRDNGESASIGSYPRVKHHPAYPNVVSVREAPIPSLIQFEHTKRYAIKVSQWTYLQFADLDGYLTDQGGFVGFWDVTNGGCLVYRVAGETTFLDQITALRLKIVKETHDLFTPAQRYVVGMMLKDLAVFAQKVASGEVAWAPGA